MCLGLPGQITATADDAGLGMGTVEVAGAARQVWLAYVPEAKTGDWVLVSAQFAVRILEPAEARETLALLRSLPPPQ